jgi:biopolymer transport protein TolR
MGMTAGKSGPKKQPEPEINVTPLVDIVLVLLIIFMVVTPAMNEGEHIELPELTKTDEKKKDLNPIEVTMAYNGRVLVNKQAIEPKMLLSTVTTLHQEKPDAVVMLNADARLDYKIVRDTFKEFQDLGFQGVSLKVAERKDSKNKTAH